jgi:hypothetical protein
LREVAHFGLCQMVTVTPPSLHSSRWGWSGRHCC